LGGSEEGWGVDLGEMPRKGAKRLGKRNTVEKKQGSRVGTSDEGFKEFGHRKNGSARPPRNHDASKKSRRIKKNWGRIRSYRERGAKIRNSGLAKRLSPGRRKVDISEKGQTEKGNGAAGPAWIKGRAGLTTGETPSVRKSLFH